MCIYICHFVDLDPVGRGFIYLFFFSNAFKWNLSVYRFRCLVMSFTRVRVVGGGCCQSWSDSVGDIERSDGTARVGIASWNHPPVWWLQCCQAVYSCHSWWLARQRRMDPSAYFSKVTSHVFSSTWQWIQIRKFEFSFTSIFLDFILYFFLFFFQDSRTASEWNVVSYRAGIYSNKLVRIGRFDDELRSWQSNWLLCVRSE